MQSSSSTSISRGLEVDESAPLHFGKEFFTHPTNGYTLLMHRNSSVHANELFEVTQKREEYLKWLEDNDLHAIAIIDTVGEFQLLFENCTFITLNLYEEDDGETLGWMMHGGRVPPGYYEFPNHQPTVLVSNDNSRQVTWDPEAHLQAVQLFGDWLHLLRVGETVSSKETKKLQTLLTRWKSTTATLTLKLSQTVTDLIRAEFEQQRQTFVEYQQAVEAQLQQHSNATTSSATNDIEVTSTQHILREQSKFTPVPVGSWTESSVRKLEQELQLCENNGDQIKWPVIFDAAHLQVLDNKFGDPPGHWKQWTGEEFIKQLKSKLKMTGSESCDSTGVNTAVSKLKAHPTFNNGLSHDHIACTAWFDTLYAQVVTSVTQAAQQTQTPEAMKVLRDYVDIILNKTFIGATLKRKTMVTVKLNNWNFTNWYNKLFEHYGSVRTIYDVFNESFYSTPTLLPADHDVKLKALHYKGPTSVPATDTYGEQVRKRAKRQNQKQAYHTPATGTASTVVPLTKAAINSNASNFCGGCGRKGHSKTTCKLGPYKTWPGHPDFNTTDVPWNESPNGIAFAKLKYADGKPILTLPFVRTLKEGVKYNGPTKDGKFHSMHTMNTELHDVSDDDEYYLTHNTYGDAVDLDIPTSTPPTITTTDIHSPQSDICMDCNTNQIPHIPITPDDTCVMCNDIKHINSIDDTLLNSKWSTHTMSVLPHPNCVSNMMPLRLEVLLDTGSLGEDGNYISQKVSRELVDRGYTPKVVNRRAHTCNGKLIIKESFQIKLKFGSSVGNTEQQIVVKCDVIDTTHDMIIGYETIKICTAVRNHLITDLLHLNSAEVDSNTSTNELEDAADYRDGTTAPEISYLRRTRKLSKVMIDVKRKRKRSEVNSTTTNQVDRLGEEIEACIRDSTPTMRHSIQVALKLIQKTFSKELNSEAAFVTPMEIGLKADSKWQVKSNSLPPRQQSRLKQQEIIIQIDKMLQSGVIRPSKASAYSQVMLTPKSNGTWRFCIDYRRLNSITDPNRFPLPRIPQMLNRIGEKKPKFFGVLDLTKGYYQAPLSEASKILTAFITPNGLYEWNRVAMGLTSAPGYFQRAMAQEILREHLYHKCELYLDDIIVFGRTEEEFVNNLQAILVRLQEHNITVNPDKCHFGLTEVEYVGHTINQEGIHFSREKLQKAINMPRPDTQKGLKSFVGLANYFRDHIRNHSSRVEPLTRLMDGYSPTSRIEWTDITNAAFEDIKKGINECPALFFVDYDAPVHLYTDASLTGIGAYVAQPINGKLVPIAFFSASLTREEKEWGIPCLEGYAIYRAFKHFDYLLRDVHTDVFTDHKNLVYIKEATESKVIRWKMELQEYSFTPAFIPGKDNPIADYWSRNPLADIDDFVIDKPATTTNMLNAITTSQQELAEQDEYVIDGPDKAIHMLNTLHTSESDFGDEEEMERELNAIKSWKTFNIPQPEYEKLRAVHDKLTGHHGVENTLRKLHLQGHKWPFMREHARRFIKECDVCQKYAFTGCEVHIPRYISGRYLPMERIAIDLIELPKSKINRRGEPEDRVIDEDGNTCILAIIDCFSRFLGLYPIKTKSAEHCASALNIHCGFFGTPCEIMGDDGFVNKVIKEYLNLLGTEHVIMMAHSHEENSIVERSNKETWKWLNAILHDKKVGRHRITKSLPFVTRIHNSTVIKSHHYTPAQIIFGDRVDLDHSILLPHTTREENIQLESTWMQEHMAVQDVILDLATQYQKAHDDTNRVNRTTKGTENRYTDFPVGSYVLLAYPTNTMTHNRRPDKLHMMFRGPYKVINRDHNEFTIENLIDGREEKKSIFMLRPFHYDPARTDPKLVALNDYDNEFFVEEILAHEGSWSRKTQMTFKVRWLGYNDTYDTWESWNTVKNNTEFHTYLHQVGRSKLIPP